MKSGFQRVHNWTAEKTRSYSNCEREAISAELRGPVTSLFNPACSLYSRTYFLEPYSSSWPWDWTSTWQSSSSWLSLLSTQSLVSPVCLARSGGLLLVSPQPAISNIAVSLVITKVRRSLYFHSESQAQPRDTTRAKETESTVSGVNTLMKDNDVMNGARKH